MKNKFKLVGIIALLAVIVFSMAVCGYDVFESEATTKGRLTITGLNDYEGEKISASSNKNYNLVGYESAKNMYNRANNTSWSYSCTSAKVVYGQAVLKVFEDRGNRPGDDGGCQNYDGNSQNVKFDIWVHETWDAKLVGTITVNFVKGIGSGIFIPKD